MHLHKKQQIRKFNFMSKNKFPSKKKHFIAPHKRPSGPLFLYGIHTVRAALDNDLRKKIRLLTTPNALMRLEEGGQIPNVKVEQTTPKELEVILGPDAVHQGVALEVEAIERNNIDSIFGAKLLLVLDQITDPHNVGAILRSACAFGADGVIATARFAPNETGVLAKSASGALDLIPFIEVTNLSKTLEKLKGDGVKILGFDSESTSPLTTGKDYGCVALVLGAEGKGLRQRTREACDEMLKLDMKGPIKSLNVSNAAAIALFAITAT